MEIVQFVLEDVRFKCFICIQQICLMLESTEILHQLTNCFYFIRELIQS